MLQMLFPLLFALVTLAIIMPEDVQYIFIRWHIRERSANQIFRYLVYTSTCTRNYRYVGTKITIWNDQVKQGLENTLTHLFQSKILLIQEKSPRHFVSDECSIIHDYRICEKVGSVCI